MIFRSFNPSKEDLLPLRVQRDTRYPLPQMLSWRLTHSEFSLSWDLRELTGRQCSALDRSTCRGTDTGNRQRSLLPGAFACSQTVHEGQR